jgi:multidrug efflux system membrane fusion protein
MSPKDHFGPTVENGVNKLKRAGFGMPRSQKAALAILVIAVLWMVSGVFNSDDADTVASGTVTSGEGGVAQNEATLIRVRVSTISSEDHVRKITILGRVEADKSVSVRAEVPGRVAEIVATKGTLVEAGEVLVKLDPENLPALLAEARARLKQREIAYQSAQKLSKGGYSSRLNVAQAKADLEAARAQVSGMQRDLNNATIVAPMTGVVDDLPLEQGDFIDKEGQIAARVIDLTSMVAVGEVAEREISSVQLGGAASVRLPDDRILDGHVSYVAKSSNALTRTFRVEVTIPVPDMSVPEGITAELNLPMEHVTAHKITPALLTLDDNGAVGVKTVNDADMVEFHPIHMVSDTEDGIWLTGLPKDVRVITVGQEFVTTGQSVIAIEGELKTQISDTENVAAQGN